MGMYPRELTTPTGSKLQAMAKKKTRIGRIHKVENKERKKFSTENLYYYAVIIKSDDGAKNYLFTESELERAAHRAGRNTEDTLDRSVISILID